VKVIGLFSVLLAATIAPAFAQTTPPMTVPLANKHLAGVVESIDDVDGEMRIVIKDNDGYDDDVTVASDAQTKPFGSQLAVGDRVLLTGYDAGGYFDATAVTIMGASAQAAPAPAAPAYTAPAAPPPANPLPSYAVPNPYPYPGYAVVPVPVYVPAPVYYAYPSVAIGVQLYGGVRYPAYAGRAFYGRPGYARYAPRPYGYRRR
jgi:hypothetical protein